MKRLRCERIPILSIGIVSIFFNINILVTSIVSGGLNGSMLRCPWVAICLTTCLPSMNMKYIISSFRLVRWEKCIEQPNTHCYVLNRCCFKHSIECYQEQRYYRFCVGTSLKPPPSHHMVGFRSLMNFIFPFGGKVYSEFHLRILTITAAKVYI